MNIKDTFCSYCGTQHGTEHYPKTCNHCKAMVWDNPLPVVVVVIEYGKGVYLVRRSIEPGNGLLALPGGFIVTGETWREAGAREVMEEINIKIDPKNIGLGSVESSSNFKNILCFGYTRITDANILPFVKNEEASERVLITKPIELAFPTHTKILANLFMSRQQHYRP